MIIRDKYKVCAGKIFKIIPHEIPNIISYCMSHWTTIYVIKSLGLQTDTTRLVMGIFIANGMLNHNTRSTNLDHSENKGFQWTCASYFTTLLYMKDYFKNTWDDFKNTFYNKFVLQIFNCYLGISALSQFDKSRQFDESIAERMSTVTSPTWRPHILHNVDDW